MVWLLATDNSNYEVVRVTDPNFFSKYNHGYLIVSMQAHKSKLIKDMIAISKKRDCPSLKNFVKDYVKDHPEYQL